MQLTSKNSKYLFNLEGEPLSAKDIAQLNAYMRSPFKAWLYRKPGYTDNAMLLFAMFGLLGLIFSLVFGCAWVAHSFAGVVVGCTRPGMYLIESLTVFVSCTYALRTLGGWGVSYESFREVSENSGYRFQDFNSKEGPESLEFYYPELQEYVESVKKLKRQLLRGEIRAMDCFIASRRERAPLSEPSDSGHPGVMVYGREASGEDGICTYKGQI